jgi:hypothetical protein
MTGCRSGKACGRGCIQYHTLQFRGKSGMIGCTCFPAPGVTVRKRLRRCHSRRRCRPQAFEMVHCRL